MAGKPQTIDQYLAALSDDQRAALEKLRKTIRAAARSKPTRTSFRNYDTSKGTIRFQADKPLPATLVRKLVRARIAENAG